MVANVEVLKWPTVSEKSNDYPVFDSLTFTHLSSQILKMVETRFQSASNEANTMASDSLEDGEVPQIVIPINGDDLVALQTQLLISSAAQLGFASAQIEAFLHPTPIEPITTPAPKLQIPSFPSGSTQLVDKKPKNNIYDLRRVKADKFTETTKKNKDRFDRLDRVLQNNGLYTMARKVRLRPGKIWQFLVVQ